MRIGGRRTLRSGEIVTWSAAEGARGTRWREAVVREGVLVRSLLLEVTPDRSPSRLELTTTVGLLTLHPEPDHSALHGNVVTPAGILHVALPWSRDHVLLVDGSPVADTVARASVDAGTGGGEPATHPGVRIGVDLRPREGRWSLDGPGSPLTESLPGDETWPLEVD